MSNHVTSGDFRQSRNNNNHHNDKGLDDDDDHGGHEGRDHHHHHDEDLVMPGFRFHPTEEELIEFYLRRKVEGKRFNVELITCLHLYRYDPWQLPALAATGEKEWYFYVPRDRKYRNGDRPNRVTTSGYWKATGADRMIRSETTTCRRPIGLKKTLVFYTGKAPKGVRTCWIMNEYRLPHHDASKCHKAEISLCRVYKRPGIEDHRSLSTRHRHHHHHHDHNAASPSSSSSSSSSRLALRQQHPSSSSKHHSNKNLNANNNTSNSLENLSAEYSDDVTTTTNASSNTSNGNSDISIALAEHHHHHHHQDENINRPMPCTTSNPVISTMAEEQESAFINNSIDELQSVVDHHISFGASSIINQQYYYQIAQQFHQQQNALHLMAAATVQTPQTQAVLAMNIVSGTTLPNNAFPDRLWEMWSP